MVFYDTVKCPSNSLTGKCFSLFRLLFLSFLNFLGTPLSEVKHAYYALISHQIACYNLPELKICRNEFALHTTFYYATIAYHVGLNAVLGLPHPGPTS